MPNKIRTAPPLRNAQAKPAPVEFEDFPAFMWRENGVVVWCAQLQKRRRHAIVIILIVGACLTPPDAASMFMVAVPMYLLYEGSIVASMLLAGRRQRRAG